MFLSREQVREVDHRAVAEYGLPAVVLMENAGRGAAELLLRLGIPGPVVICCGKGNNGGDGFVIARHLANHHVPVRVHLFARPEELSGEAAVNYKVLVRADMPIKVYAAEAIDTIGLREELATAAWVVDALLGTGLSGPVRGGYAQAIAAINEWASHVLAVDIPSGLDCDTGEPLGLAVRAEHTATFVAQKKGFANPQAKQWLGQVHVLDIGVPRPLVDTFA